MPQQDHQLTSRELSKKIASQRKEIAHNDRYKREQEQLIETMINTGNNHIRELTLESDEINQAITESKAELIDLATKIDNKRYELLGLQ